MEDRFKYYECKNFEWKIMIIDDNYFCVFFFIMFDLLFQLNVWQDLVL